MTTIKTSHSPASPLLIHVLMLAKRRDLLLAQCSACNASIARGDHTRIVPRANVRMHLTRKQSYEGSRDGAGPPSRLAHCPGWAAAAAAPALADAAGAELHADPGASGPRGLGDGMFPGALAAAAHHQQVAMAEAVAERGTAMARPQ